MEFVELKKHIKTQKPCPCYVCYGDDMFLLDRAAAIIGGLAGEPKIFNLTDKQFDSAKELTDELMQLPMMSEYRVVIARGKPDDNIFAAVTDYLGKPNPSTVLVLVYHTPHDSWSKAPTIKLPAGSMPVVCSRLSVTHVYAFERAIAAKNNSQFEDEAVRLLFNI